MMTNTTAQAAKKCSTGSKEPPVRSRIQPTMSGMQMPPTLPAMFIMPPTVATRERGASMGGKLQYMLPHMSTKDAQDSRMTEEVTSGT